MRSLAALLLLLLGAPCWADAQARTIKVAPDVEVPISVYGESTAQLVLWLPSERGVVDPEHEIAQQLAKRGYEVWIADLFGARFLPAVPSSLGAIPASDVAQLIQAGARHHPKVYLLSSGQGAGLALEGARQSPVTGAVLLFPNLHAAIPVAGEAPTYLPIAAQTRLPIAILQGKLSPWYWQLDALTAQLEHGGSRVARKVLSGLRDRYYFRPDANPRERAARGELAAAIDDSIRHLPALQPEKTP
jgi:dienelactone hydrolase